MSDNNFETTLSSLFANEDLMSKISEIAKQNTGGDISSAIPEVMNILSSSGVSSEKSVDDSPKNTEDESEKEVFAGKVETSDFSDGMFPRKALESFGKSISKNSQLLRALKPYLSHERAEMIDSIIRISQIADIMKFAKWGRICLQDTKE